MDKRRKLKYIYMIEIHIIYATGFEEKHVLKSKKTIQYTCPDGARIRSIKIKQLPK